MQVETDVTGAILKKYPEQIVILFAKEQSGRVNPITIGWTMITSHHPPMMAISVGITRYSLNIIREAVEFVIAFPSAYQEKETLLFGTKSGSNAHKLKESGVSTSPAKQIDCLLLYDAVANFECSLAGEFISGDHVIFVGNIIKAHINPVAPGRLYTIAKEYKMSGVSVNKADNE